VSHLDDGHVVNLIEKFPATFVRGRGRLAGPLRAEVTTRNGEVRALRARHAIVVATGSDPAIPEAVNAEVPLDRLWHAVATFPTVSETWLRLLEECGL
jgi:pyruvate/2-oxoglutarate dehydrogenase complex dihydrolipoamide dehydrogenase (E3) component